MRESTKFALKTLPLAIVLSIIFFILNNIILIYMIGFINGCFITTIIFFGRILENIERIRKGA